MNHRKTRTVLIYFVLVSILTSCLPFSGKNNKASAESFIHAKMEQDAVLFDGPGNTDFKVLTSINAGTPILVKGEYGDFYQIQINTPDFSGIGFVGKHTIALKSGITVRQLQTDEIPLNQIFDIECSPGEFNPSTKEITLSTNSMGYDIESSVYQLTSPLIISIEKMRQSGEWASLKYFGWDNQIRLDITVMNGYYFIGIRDKTSPDFKVQISEFGIRGDDPLTIRFLDIEGKAFQVLNGDNKIIREYNLKKLGLKIEDGLFPGGNFYWGISIIGKSTFYMKNLQIGTISTGRWAEESDYFEGMASLVKNNKITLGAEFNIGPMLNKKYCHAFMKNFNLVATGYFGDPTLWSGPDSFEFDLLDLYVNYAVRNHWRIRAHHLLDCSQFPDWFLNGNYTKEEYKKLLETMIKTVMGRYKGVVQEWSLANEAIQKSLGRGTVEYCLEKIGPEYIELVFKWAHEADPDAILLLNDGDKDGDPNFNWWSGPTTEEMIRVIGKLKEKGVPIDAVGIGMHISGLPVNTTNETKMSIINMFNRFSELGLKIIVSELDVDLQGVPGSESERWNLQGKIYANMLKSCLETESCISFSIWGVTDSISWLSYNGEEYSEYLRSGIEPLPFDFYVNPKPAFFAMRNVLYESNGYSYINN